VLSNKTSAIESSKDDHEKGKEEKNKDFDFVENIIKAENLGNKMTAFSTDEAYDIVSKCEE